MDVALNAPADPASSDRPTGSHPGRLLDNLWIAASSPQLTIALAVLLALTLALAALLPQLPAGLDPASAGRWLSTAAARYGRFGSFLSSSGLFNLLAGPWIVILFALNALHLSLRVANQARRLAVGRPQVPLAPQGLPFELLHLPLSVHQVEPKVAAIAASPDQGTPGQGTVVSAAPGAVRPRVDAYREHRSWAGVGPLLTYLGPLLIVAGLFWNALGGWRASDVALTPGRTVQPAQAGGLSLSLVSAGGAPGGGPTVLSLTRGAQTRNTWLDYARPATWGSVWVAQRSSGPALQVQASAAGKTLPLQSLQGEPAPVETLHLRFGQNESEQAFSIPGRDLALRVVSYESLAERGIRGPVFLVEGYLGSDPTPQLNELIEDQGTIEWQGVTLALQREAYVVVDLAAMPGLPLLALGGLVLLAGVAITAWGGLTRTWLNAAAERDGTLVAVRVAAPAAGQELVARAAATLATEAGVEPIEMRRGVAITVRQGAYIAGGALLFAGVAFFAVRGLSGIAPQARSWIFFLHAVLAALGLGALVVGAVQSLWFAVRSNSSAEMVDPALPAEAQAMRGRAGDPGRAISLAAYPLLTVALLLGGVWALVAFAVPLRVVASEIWLLVSWLLAAAYFHATSGWRPLRISAWWAVLLILAALAAGIAASVAASSLLTV